jgi:hypothetical protein
MRHDGTAVCQGERCCPEALCICPQMLFSVLLFEA